VDAAIILKFAHVALAIIWLGGGMCLILLGTFLGRDPAPAAVMTVVRQVAVFAPRVFIPASVLVLASGAALAWIAGWGWSAWVVLGLAGIGFTGVFGARVLGPMAERAVTLADTQGDAAGAPVGLRMLQLARFDYVVQFAIVFLMVAKPGWSDAATLAVPALLVAGGGLAFLRAAAPAAA
jgi:uncharacterized membrane protein